MNTTPMNTPVGFFQRLTSTLIQIFIQTFTLCMFITLTTDIRQNGYSQEGSIEEWLSQLSNTSKETSKRELSLKIKTYVRSLKDQNQRTESELHNKRDQNRRLTQDLQRAQVRLLESPFQIRELETLSKAKIKSMRVSRKKARFLSTAHDSPKKRRLEEIVGGRVALFAFWATWCKPCVSAKEQEHLRQLERALRPYQIPLVSIAIDQWRKVNAQRSRWFYPLWQLEDAHFEMIPEQIMKKVGLGLPLFILRGAQGEVEYFHPKILNERAVEEWVTAAVRVKLQQR